MALENFMSFQELMKIRKFQNGWLLMKICIWPIYYRIFQIYPSNWQNLIYLTLYHNFLHFSDFYEKNLLESKAIKWEIYKSSLKWCYHYPICLIIIEKGYIMNCEGKNFPRWLNSHITAVTRFLIAHRSTNHYWANKGHRVPKSKIRNFGLKKRNTCQEVVRGDEIVKLDVCSSDRFGSPITMPSK